MLCTKVHLHGLRSKNGAVGIDHYLSARLTTPMSWRHADELRERAREMALIGKSASHADLRERMVRVLQKLTSLVDTPLQQPLMRRALRGLEIGRAHV